MLQVLSTTEAVALTARALSAPTSHRLALDLMLNCGLRVGEVTGLQWSDLLDGPLPTQCLTIRATTTKTHKPRDLPLPATTQALIIAHLVYATGAHGTTPPLDWPAIPGTRTQPWSTRWLQLTVARLSAAALGHAIHPHTLRHTFATRLLATCRNIRIVQDALGHASLRTTQLYTHPNLNDLRAAMNTAAAELDVGAHEPAA